MLASASALPSMRPMKLIGAPSDVQEQRQQREDRLARHVVEQAGEAEQPDDARQPLEPFEGDLGARGRAGAGRFALGARVALLVTLRRQYRMVPPLAPGRRPSIFPQREAEVSDLWAVIRAIRKTAALPTILFGPLPGR